jgi:hypothetical protein
MFIIAKQLAVMGKLINGIDHVWRMLNLPDFVIFVQMTSAL